MDGLSRQMAEPLGSAHRSSGNLPSADPRRRLPLPSEPRQLSLATGFNIGPNAICIYISFFIRRRTPPDRLKNIKNVLEVIAGRFGMEQIVPSIFYIVFSFSTEIGGHAFVFHQGVWRRRR